MDTPPLRSSARSKVARGSNGDVKLAIRPPTIMPWLTRDQKRLSLVLLDLEADRLDEGALRLDLNIVFNPVPVRRGKIMRYDFYIGSTGAEISIEAAAGRVLDHTQPAVLEVNYSNSSTRTRKAALTLKPALKAKTGGSDIDASLGSIARESGQERSFTAEFACEERVLGVRVFDDQILWTITLPRRESVISDFLAGNLYLFAECKWFGLPRAGTVSVRPSDVRFFDDNRKALGKVRSLIMACRTWTDGVKIQNSDGVSMNFEEIVG